MGEDGPSDSALAAARGWRLRRTAVDRHAARCASRALCSGGAPRRYSPSEGKNLSTEHRIVPYAIVTDPQLGGVGMTEKDARARGYRLRIGTSPMTAVPR